MKKRCFAVFLFVIIFIPVLIIMLSVGLTVRTTSPGGQMPTAVFELLNLEEGVSSRWCEAMSVSVTDGLVSARLMTSLPQPVPNSKMTLTSNNTAVVLQNQHVSWQYYAPNNSVLRIEECASLPGILAFVFRGKTIDERCIRESVTKEVKELCKSLTITRNLLRICRPSKYTFEVPVVEGDYYHMVYLGLETEAEVLSIVTLTQPVYSWNSSQFNCTIQSTCSVPLPYLINHTVTVQIESSSNSDPKVIWNCVPRKTILVGSFFGALGGVIIILVGIGFVLRNKWSQDYDQLFVNNDDGTRLIHSDERTNVNPVPIYLSLMRSHENLRTENESL